MWLECFFVTLDAQETNLGGRQQLGNALQHAEAGSQNWHNKWSRVAQGYTLGWANRSGHANLLGANAARCLIGQQRHQLGGELAKLR